PRTAWRNDAPDPRTARPRRRPRRLRAEGRPRAAGRAVAAAGTLRQRGSPDLGRPARARPASRARAQRRTAQALRRARGRSVRPAAGITPFTRPEGPRSEEHTSELQSRENLV